MGMDLKKKALMVVGLIGAMVIVGLIGGWAMPGFFSQMTLGQAILITLSVLFATVIGLLYAQGRALTAEDIKDAGGYKRGAGNALWFLGLGLLVAACLVVITLSITGIIHFGGAPQTPLGPSGEQLPAATQPNFQPTLTIVSTNLAVPATSVGSNSDIYNKASGVLVKSQLAAGTAQNVDANTAFHIFTNASGYFSAITEFDNTGKATPTVPVSLADDTTATVTIYNAGTYTTNALAAQQAFAANDQKTMEIRLSGAVEKYLSNPNINKVRFAFILPTPSEWLYSSNSDTYMEYDNVKCASVATPVTGGNRQVAFECPTKNGGYGTSPQSYFLTLKASATGGSEQNITMSVWGVDYFKNTKTAVFNTGIYGAEDDAGTKLHTETNATIFIS